MVGLGGGLMGLPLGYGMATFVTRRAAHILRVSQFGQRDLSRFVSIGAGDQLGVLAGGLVAGNPRGAAPDAGRSDAAQAARRRRASLVGAIHGPVGAIEFWLAAGDSQRRAA